MAIFTSKIICSHCSKFYKRKQERGKFKWVCQGYDNYAECQRNVIDEKVMMEFISRRLPIQDRVDDKVIFLIENKVSKIEVEDKGKFMIHMVNDEPMYIKNNHIHY